MPKKKVAAKKPTGGSLSKKPSTSSKPAKAAQASSAPRSSKPSPAAAAKVERKPANYGGTIEHDVSLERMHVDPANARRHPERNMQTIMASLRQHGQVEPLVVRLEDGQVIGGNGRYEAMRLLGWTACTVTWVDKSTIDAMGLGITLNRSAEQAEWDLDVLDKLTVNLEDAGVDLTDLGFTGDELDDLLEAGDGDPANDSDVEEGDIPEPPAKPKTKPGDVWLLGEHLLHCIDAGEMNTGAYRGRARVLLTDPPYGISQTGVPNDGPEQLPAVVAAGVSAACDVLAPDSISIVFQSTRTFPEWLRQYTEAGQKFERMLWLYKEAQCTFPWRGWILTSEAILVFSNGKPVWHEKKPYKHDCYKLSEVSGELVDDWHGSVKPLRVVLDLLERTTGGGDWVFDPFCGSGTTLIACETSKRRCLACEIDPGYCDVIVARWERMTEKKATLQAADAVAKPAR